jgi:hypothetical protein
LRHSFFTRWRKKVVEFDFTDSGKTRICNAAYFAAPVENSSGKQGPWEPLVLALIP